MSDETVPGENEKHKQRIKRVLKVQTIGVFLENDGFPW